MKVSFRVTGYSNEIHNRGEIISKVISLETPEGLNEYQKDQYPADNSIDFRDHWVEIDMVQNWEVLTSKELAEIERPETIIDIIDNMVSSEEIKVNVLLAFYKMEGAIDGLSPINQFLATMKALNLALESQIYAYTSLSEYSEKVKKDLAEIKEKTPRAWYITALKEYKKQSTKTIQ